MWKNPGIIRPGATDPSMIKWERQESKWSFDYTDFDKWVNFLLTKIGVSYIECFSIVPWENILRFREEGTERVCRRELLARKCGKKYGALF